MGLLDYNVPSNIPTLIGRSIGAAVGGDMPRSAYYRMQHNIGRGARRAHESTRREQIRSAMSELIRLPQEAYQDQNKFFAAIDQIASKYPQVGPEELTNAAMAVAKGRNFFDNKEWTQTQRDWTKEDRDYTTGTVRPFEDKRRKRLEGDWEYQDTQREQKLLDDETKRQRESEMYPIQKELVESRIDANKALIDQRSGKTIDRKEVRAVKKEIRQGLKDLGIEFGYPMETEQQAKVVDYLNRYHPEFRAIINKKGELENIIYDPQPESKPEPEPTQTVAPKDPEAEIQRLLQKRKVAQQTDGQPGMANAASEQQTEPPETEAEESTKKTQVVGPKPLETNLTDEDIHSKAAIDRKGTIGGRAADGAYVIFNPETGTWFLAKNRDRIKIREALGEKTVSENIKENINIVPSQPQKGTALLNFRR